jgi:hypothetical protein
LSSLMSASIRTLPRRAAAGTPTEAAATAARAGP